LGGRSGRGPPSRPVGRGAWLGERRTHAGVPRQSDATVRSTIPFARRPIPPGLRHLGHACAQSASNGDGSRGTVARRRRNRTLPARIPDSRAVVIWTRPRRHACRRSRPEDAPERDPAFRESRLDCGAFAIRAARFGNVVVAMKPSHDLPPSHGYLAFYAWIADGIRAQAIVNLSKDGVPDAVVCALPRLA